MHGLGNDYVYVDCFSETVENPVATAKAVSRRRFSIGADGLILICPSEKGDARMEMYNADGSRGEMCGNGIRCVAKYVYDHGIARRDQLNLETDIGVLPIDLVIEKDKAVAATVNMGPPRLKPEEIPIDLAHGDGKSITVGDQTFEITCVSMGNPHCVIFVDEEVDDLDIETPGKAIENHPLFPNRTNVEFIKVLSDSEVDFRVWERGSGETLACGTGACAAAVAAHLVGHTGRKVQVNLCGGPLDIEWRESDGNVYMTGPATEAFTGEIAV